MASKFDDDKNVLTSPQLTSPDMNKSGGTSRGNVDPPTGNKRTVTRIDKATGVTEIIELDENNSVTQVTRIHPTTKDTSPVDTAKIEEADGYISPEPKGRCTSGFEFKSRLRSLSRRPDDKGDKGAAGHNDQNLANVQEELEEITIAQRKTEAKNKVHKFVNQGLLKLNLLLVKHNMSATAQSKKFEDFITAASGDLKQIASFCEQVQTSIRDEYDKIKKSLADNEDIQTGIQEIMAECKYLIQREGMEEDWASMLSQARREIREGSTTD